MKNPKASPFSQAGQPSGQPNAFTLIELLVVIIIIAILAALLLPTLAAAKAKGQGALCVSNIHQLVVGWTSYSNDNRDRLCQNLATDWGGWDGNLADLGSYASGQSQANWILGDATNNLVPNWINLLTYGLLYPYTGNYHIYQCPANNKLDRWGMTTQRGYSMNAWMGVTASQAWKNDQMNFVKTPELAILGSANAWVFMEENQSTINDGSLVEDVPQNEPAPAVNYWVDCPGRYHVNAGAVAFSDGHGQIRKWTDAYILADTPQGSEGNFPADPTSQDIFWVLSHTTISLVGGGQQN
jgi:prepilin-type N-terminal cleavage/methylation domain-containing protein